MNVKRWAQGLREEYPQGLLGEREALVNLLVGKGLSHAEAAGVARALEAQGYAHFLPGDSPELARDRLLFRFPEALRLLG